MTLFRQVTRKREAPESTPAPAVHSLRGLQDDWLAEHPTPEAAGNIAAVCTSFAEHRNWLARDASLGRCPSSRIRSTGACRCAQPFRD